MSAPMGMFAAAVPTSVQVLNAVSAMLGKAAPHCAERKVDEAVLLGSRLALDMLPLARQVQIAADFPKNLVARLAGVPIPSMPDTETTVAELQDRLARTVAFIGGFTPAQLDGTEAKEISFKVAGQEMRFTGQLYLLHFMLPNLHFHAATAYGIMRHNGVPLGKRDYMGAIPVMG